MRDRRLSQLSKYLSEVDPDTSQSDFWAGWDAISGDLCKRVWADDADPELREAYTDLLACADDAGWAVPMDHCQR